MSHGYVQPHNFQDLPSIRPSSNNPNQPNPSMRPSSRHKMPNDSGHNQVNHTDIEKRIKYVAYGGKAAFQIEQSITKDGRHTIMVESAPKINTNDPNDKRYEWTNKLSFQLSQEELPFMIGVLLGIIPSVRFDMHGSDNSKFLEIINQGNKFFFKNGAAEHGLKVAPISIVEGFQFGLLGLNQYTKNYPDLSSDAILTTIRMFLANNAKSGIYKQPKT